MNYNNIINKARVLSDTQHDNKNSSPEELLVFLNIVVKNIYEDCASWANPNISVFTPVIPELVEVNAQTTFYNTDNYRIPIPEDLHTLVGLRYSQDDRVTPVNNISIEQIGEFYYFSYVNYAETLYLEYIPAYTDVSDLDTVLPRFLRINTTYLEYALAVQLARSAGDGDTVSALREEMKMEMIYLRGSTGSMKL